MSARGGHQQLISQWIRQPLGSNRSSLAVNINGVNIKRKNGIQSSKINKVVVSKVAQSENLDISTLCNVVKVSPRKVVLNTSSHDIQVPGETSAGSSSATTKSYSSHDLQNVNDVDSGDAGFPLLVSEYVQDIYQHLWCLETQHCVPKDFLEGQKVSSWMRSTVIDWLIQLQVGFTLLPETLYLTVDIMDRYLTLGPRTPCDQLQLLAVTSMFIASKYEETQAPGVSAFAYLTDDAFSVKDIIKKEIHILNALKGYVSFPLPLHFLRRNSKVGGVGPASHTLSKYILELCLTEYAFSHVRASLQAAAALCLSLKLLGGQEWTANLAYYSGYTEAELLPTMCRMAVVVRRCHSSKYQAARTKYSSEAFMRISLIPHLKSKFVVKLASKVRL